MNLTYLFIVGEEFEQAAKNNKYFQERAIFKKNSQELREYLLKNKISGATLLIKGSRSIKLEKVVYLFI